MSLLRARLNSATGTLVSASMCQTTAGVALPEDGIHPVLMPIRTMQALSDSLATLRCGAAVTVTLGTLAAAGLYAVKAPCSQVFGPSVCEGSGDRRSIALTFDDGPSPGTLDLLEYLDQHGVRATFFQCGANVVRHPEITRAVCSRGHEIGNHTFTHARLCPRLGWQPNVLSRSRIFAEFARTQTVLRKLGVQPTLLRVPYGLRWFGLRETQRRLNLRSVLWTVIGHDWECTGPTVAKLVLAKAAPGGIVCLHDGRDTRENPNIGSTLAAVKRIVPILKNQGYSFESVSDLLQKTRSVTP